MATDSKRKKINTVEIEGISAEIQGEINSAIDTFIREYESEHRVTIINVELESQNTTIENTSRHFASEIKFLKVVFEKDAKKIHLSVVIKIPQLSPNYEKFKSIELYKKEKFMYETVLPRMHEFWPHEKISPQFYVSTESCILMLENLLESGFYIPQKNCQFNLTECKLVLNTLAKFHAVSVKYLETYKVELDPPKFLTQDQSPGFTSLFIKIRQHIIPSLSESQVAQWTQFEKNCIVVITEAYLGKDDGLNVICHGDMQHNNLLFQNDQQGRMSKCKFIDFQFSRGGSPVIDLMYFSVISVQFEVFKEHRDTIFSYYVDTLNETLKELDSKSSYNLEQLNADFIKYKYFLLFTLVTVVPVLRTVSSNLNNLIKGGSGEEDHLEAVIKSEEYISLFKNWIQFVE